MVVDPRVLLMPLGGVRSPSATCVVSSDSTVPTAVNTSPNLGHSTATATALLLGDVQHEAAGWEKKTNGTTKPTNNSGVEDLISINVHPEEDHSSTSRRLSSYEAEMAALFCLCHVCMGLSMGGISPAMEAVTADFQLSDWWRGLLGAAALAGNMMGSPMAGFIADKWGRKTCMLTAWTVCAVATILQGISYQATQLLIARTFVGWAVGAHYTGTTAFLSETLHPQHVGKILSLVELHFFLGNFLSIGIGAVFQSILTNDSIRWRLNLSLCAVPMVIGLVWILLRGREPSVQEYEEEEEQQHHHQDPQDSINQSDITEPINNNRHTSILCTRTIAQRLTFASIFWGTLVIPTYAVSAFAVAIITDLQLNLDPFMLNTFLGLAAAVGVVMGMLFVDKLGRKPLLLASQWGVGLSFILLASINFLSNARSGGGDDNEHQQHSSWIIALLVGLFLVFELFNGFGAPLAMIYPAELFPAKIKGFAAGICAMNSRIMAVVSILILAPTLSLAGVNTLLLIIGVVSAAGAVVTHVMAPRMPPLR